MIGDSGKIFWADSGLDAVYSGYVTDSQDHDKKLLKKGLSDVADVKVLEEKGGGCDKLFVALPDKGIYTMSCDGSNYTAYNTDTKPNALAVYTNSSKLYWSTADTVYRCNIYTGEDIETVHQTCPVDHTLGQLTVPSRCTHMWILRVRLRRFSSEAAKVWTFSTSRLLVTPLLLMSTVPTSTSSWT